METLTLFNCRNSKIEKLTVYQIVNNIYMSKKPTKYYFLDNEKNNLYEILKKDIPYLLEIE